MKRFNQYKVALFFIVFMIFQPVIDIFTMFGIQGGGGAITPGIIIRMIALAFGGIFMLVRVFQKKDIKLGIYTIGLVLFVIINLGVSFYNKPVFNLFSELTMLAKHLYTVFMFIIFIMSIELFVSKNNEKSDFIPLVLSGSAIFINLAFILATVTGTGKRTYNALYKTGHTAWFFAGNEIGSILAILLPIILLNIFLVKTRKLNYLMWTVFILTIISMSIIGTKAASFSILITLIMANVSSLIIYLAMKKSNKTNFIGTKKDRVLLMLTFIVVAGTFPLQPAISNSTGEYQARVERSKREGANKIDNNDYDEDAIDDDFFGEPAASGEVTIADVVYSGRSGFLEMNKKFFREAPMSQKIFGMGYAGNYIQKPKLVERDFHDLFFQFGILGTFLLLLPFIYYALRVIKDIFSDISHYVNIRYSMVFTSITLGFGIALFGGHVFYSPAVSIYLCYILAYLVVKVTKRKDLLYE